MPRLILIFMLTIGRCGAAFAQSPSPEHRKFEVTGFAGKSFVRDLEFPTKIVDGDQITSRTVGLQYDPGYQVGVRLAQHFGEYWAANLEYSFADQRLRFENLFPAMEGNSLRHFVHQFSYGISFSPARQDYRFRPYAKVGLGSTLFYISESAKEDASLVGLRLRDSWRFAGVAGAGFKFLIADRAVFTLELKDHISGVPSYGLPLSGQVTGSGFRPGIGTSGVLHNWQIDAGLGFQWDGTFWSRW